AQTGRRTPVADPVVVALTPRGLELGQRLVQALGRGEVVPAQPSAADCLSGLFHTGRPLVCIMALGIVVRILGPLARGKVTDPAGVTGGGHLAAGPLPFM